MTIDLLIRFSANAKTLDCFEALLELQDLTQDDEMLTVAFSLLDTEDQGQKTRQMAALDKLVSQLGAADVAELVRQKLPTLLQLNAADASKRWRFIQLATAHLNAMDNGNEFLLHQLLEMASSPTTLLDVKLKSINLLTAALMNSSSSFSVLPWDSGSDVHTVWDGPHLELRHRCQPPRHCCRMRRHGSARTP